jgi:hypothetical protein
MKVPSYGGAIKSIFCEGWGYDNQKHISGSVFTLPFKVLWLLLTSLFFLTIRIIFMVAFPVSALLVLHIRKKEYARAKEFFENPSKYF